MYAYNYHLSNNCNHLSTARRQAESFTSICCGVARTHIAKRRWERSDSDNVLLMWSYFEAEVSFTGCDLQRRLICFTHWDVVLEIFDIKRYLYIYEWGLLPLDADIRTVCCANKFYGGYRSNSWTILEFESSNESREEPSAPWFLKHSYEQHAATTVPSTSTTNLGTTAYAKQLETH